MRSRGSKHGAGAGGDARPASGAAADSAVEHSEQRQQFRSALRDKHPVVALRLPTPTAAAAAAAVAAPTDDGAAAPAPSSSAAEAAAVAPPEVPGTLVSSDTGAAAAAAAPKWDDTRFANPSTMYFSPVVPALTLLTGTNNAGKSRLLDVLSDTGRYVGFRRHKFPPVQSNFSLHNVGRNEEVSSVRDVFATVAGNSPGIQDSALLSATETYVAAAAGTSGVGATGVAFEDFTEDNIVGRLDVSKAVRTSTGHHIDYFRAHQLFEVHEPAPRSLGYIEVKRHDRERKLFDHMSRAFHAVMRRWLYFQSGQMRSVRTTANASRPQFFVSLGSAPTMVASGGVEQELPRAFEPRGADNDVYKQLFTLQEMGMGARGLVAVLMFLFNYVDLGPPRHLLCIDEPEQFLPPPQQERLGTVLADLTPRVGNLVLATHSAVLMRGCLLPQSFDPVDDVGVSYAALPAAALAPVAGAGGAATVESRLLLRLARLQHAPSNYLAVADVTSMCTTHSLSAYNSMTNVLEGLTHPYVAFVEEATDALLFKSAMRLFVNRLVRDSVLHKRCTSHLLATADAAEMVACHMEKGAPEAAAEALATARTLCALCGEATDQQIAHMAKQTLRAAAAAADAGRGEPPIAATTTTESAPGDSDAADGATVAAPVQEACAACRVVVAQARALAPRLVDGALMRKFKHDLDDPSHGDQLASLREVFWFSLGGHTKVHHFTKLLCLLHPNVHAWLDLDAGSEKGGMMNKLQTMMKHSALLSVANAVPELVPTAEEARAQASVSEGVSVGTGEGHKAEPTRSLERCAEDVTWFIACALQDQTQSKTWRAKYRGLAMPAGVGLNSKQIKRGGLALVASTAESTGTAMGNALRAVTLAAEVGIVLVPIGELEAWLGYHRWDPADELKASSEHVTTTTEGWEMADDASFKGLWTLVAWCARLMLGHHDMGACRAGNADDAERIRSARAEHLCTVLQELHRQYHSYLGARAESNARTGTPPATPAPRRGSGARRASVGGSGGRHDIASLGSPAFSPPGGGGGSGNDDRGVGHGGGGASSASATAPHKD